MACVGFARFPTAIPPQKRLVGLDHSLSMTEGSSNLFIVDTALHDPRLNQNEIDASQCALLLLPGWVSLLFLSLSSRLGIFYGDQHIGMVASAVYMKS